MRKHMLASGLSADDVLAADTGSHPPHHGPGLDWLPATSGLVAAAVTLAGGPALTASTREVPASSATGTGGSSSDGDDDIGGGGLTLLGDDSDGDDDAGGDDGDQVASSAAASGAGSSGRTGSVHARGSSQTVGSDTRRGDPLAPPLWYNPKVLGFPTELLPLQTQRTTAAIRINGGTDTSGACLWESGIVPTVAPSPDLSTLCSLLPAVASTFDWRCVYTTSRHAWTLGTLQQHCDGLAPLLLVFHVRVRTDDGFSSGSSSRSHDDRTVGVFTTSGISAPRMGRPSRWKGHPQDALFQLSPEVAHFAALPPGVAEIGDAATDRKRASTQGIALEYDMIVHSSSDRLLLGGSRCSPVPAIALDPALTKCSLLGQWMQSLRAMSQGEESVAPSLTAASTTIADVLGIEAFAFVNRGGSLHAGKGPGDVEAARRTGDFLTKQERKDRNDVAERVQTAADIAKAIAGEDMRAAKEAASASPGSTGAAAAMEKARQSAAQAELLAERYRRAQDIAKMG